MTLRGQGDRWLAGDVLGGVEFQHRASVEIIDGVHAGKKGTVAFLMNLDADPLYLVELVPSGGDVRVHQSRLRASA